MQSDRGKQAERRPQEVHLPPAGVDVGLQCYNHYDRHHKAAEQQDAKSGFAVAESGKGTGDCLPTDRRASDSTQRQRDRRRGDGKPNGDVVPRHGVGQVNLAHKQVLYNGGMLGQHSDALNEPQRIFPVVRVDDVQRGKRRRREYRGRRQDAIALCPARCLPQVGRAHREYERQQHQPEHAQVYRQACGNAAQQERADGVFAKGAVGEVERDYHQRRKGDVFGVEERVGVQARV